MNARKLVPLVVALMVAGGISALGPVASAFALATPTISTSAQPASATVGSSIADKATVSGQAAYACPPVDEAGFAAGSFSDSGGVLFCSYPAFAGENPDDFYCDYSDSTGALTQDNDVGFCPPSAVSLGGGGGGGGATPTGTVTFNLYDNPNGSGSPLFTDSNVSLVGGSATSASYTATAAGTDYWVVSYSGDGTYSPASSGNSSGAVAINTASPTLSGSGGGSVALGSAISDSATISGGYLPGGSVSFILLTGGTCSGTQVGDMATVPVSGDGTYPSGSIATPDAGTYSVAVSYEPDANNAAPAAVCDVYTLAQASPALVGSGGGTGTLGSAISDSATITGGFEPGGSLSFELLTGGTCSGTQVGSTATVSVSGDGTYPSGSIAMPGAGTSSVLVSYAPDVNNATPAAVCDVYTVAQASPALAGSGGGSTTAGSAVSDSATITGGFEPGGSVSFHLLMGGSCSGTQVGSTATVSVSGDGTYPSGSIAMPGAGTSSVLVSYTPDANNATPATVCDVYTVAQASPALTGSSGGSATIGSSVSDKATLSGGFRETGSIVFKLYGPNDSTCSHAPAFTSTAVTVSGNRAYTSPTFTPTVLGAYRWVAAYSGDSNNAAVSTACGASGESVTVGVSPTTVTLSSSANPAVAGKAVTFTARVTGVKPTGHVAFKNGSSTLGTGAVNGSGLATLTTSKLPVGSDKITASYGGDADNSQSSSKPLTEVITKVIPPPSTAITGKNISAAKAKVTVDFNGSGGVGKLHFQCKLDSGAWKSCTSPKTYSGLTARSHTFEVRAIDTRGQADPTPATLTFKI